MRAVHGEMLLRRIDPAAPCTDQMLLTVSILYELCAAPWTFEHLELVVPFLLTPHILGRTLEEGI